MGTYMQPVNIPGIDIDATPNYAVLSGKAQSVTISPDSVIGFRGLDIAFQVVAIHPNGLTMIDSKYSIQAFYSWRKLFIGNRRNTMWMDCLMNTGWMEVS